MIIIQIWTTQNNNHNNSNKTKQHIAAEVFRPRRGGGELRGDAAADVRRAALRAGGLWLIHVW